VVGIFQSKKDMQCTACADDEGKVYSSPSTCHQEVENPNGPQIFEIALLEKSGNVCSIRQGRDDQDVGCHIKDDARNDWHL
jgi:hypothetical protein